MGEPEFLVATRTSYDALAPDYPDFVLGDLDAKPLDRAWLGVFAELVGPGRPVLDVGSGTGRITAYLTGLGLDARGVDLSPGMVAVARRTHPDLRFDVGSMTALDVPDGSFAGVLAYYSVIHIEPEWLPTVFAEFHRVLEPGGQLLMVFQSGDDVLHLSEGLGHDISLDFRRLDCGGVATLLADAGITVHTRAVREPDPGVERTPQGYLLARKD